MLNVQIFGVKNSPATRAAERFFKERRISIQFVDLNKKPMASGEIKRFVDRFGLNELIDTEGAAYLDAGLKYMKISQAELLQRIEQDPKLLRLPLVRSAHRLSVGHDETGWKAMLADVKI
jgi:arsenate reductase-like glutaredoxin family protein